MKYILKIVKYLTAALVSVVVLFFLTIGTFKIYQWRKHSTVMSIGITRVQHGCEEGCNDYKVRAVDNSDFSWLVGKVVNIKRYTPTQKHGLDQEWYEQGYKVFCVTGKLHKAKDHFFWFYPRDVYNFTGSAVRPGMCSNPKAKRFKP